MAKRDILKEAIADAKTVKETAIANAKAALEEAFTPQLKSMLAAKLEEIELDEEMEDKKKKDLDEAPMKAEKTNKKGQPDMRKEKEYKPEKMTRDRIKEEDLDEEIDLDEILAEIDEEMKKDDLKEDERTDAEEEGFLDGKEDGKEEEKKDMEDEEIDLDDMTDDDLKGFIEDVIADMVASGELEAGENFEEEGEEEMKMDTEVDVEVSEAKKKKKDEEDKDLKEVVDFINEVYGRGGAEGAAAGAAEIAKALSKLGVNIKKLGKAGMDKLMDLLDFSEPASPLQKKLRDAGTGKTQRFQNRYEEDGIDEAKKDEIDEAKKDEIDEAKKDDENVKEAKAKKDEELKEAYDTIESLRSDLHEVNLLNAKLLYTNKIFKAKTLTESQKVKVLGAFDKANTVKESKLVFETLNEGLKAKKSPIKESLGAASRVSGNINTKKPIIKADPMVERFKKLAGLT